MIVRPTGSLCKVGILSVYFCLQVKTAVAADKVPICVACTSGVVKPDVIFFGEDLPGRFKELLESDFSECDLLIVMGTSLQVQPFSSLILRVNQTTPRLLVSLRVYVCNKGFSNVRDRQRVQVVLCLWYPPGGGSRGALLLF
jgi:NAD-dependent SIR2 family protein deacetylase